MKTGWLNNRWVVILFHITAWIIIFLLPFLLNRYPVNETHRPPNDNGFQYVNNLTGLLWVILFYLNAYFLIPALFYKKKYWVFFILLIGIFIVFLVVHIYLFKFFITNREFILSRSIGFNLPPFMLTVAVSTAYRMIIDKNKTDKLLQKTQEEKLKSELSFLRSQVSPHFMFNVLNNILALARLKSDQLEPTIFKLSTLMRYMLYETDEERVSLQKEIDYLNSYIDLQKQRIGGKVRLDVNIPVAQSHHEIAPMLLIPFIENAFKHGTGHIKNAQIEISLVVEKNMLNFTVRNRYDIAETNDTKDNTSGIGLINVVRRLNLLYKDKHNLLITKEDDWFIVSLQLNL